MSSKDPKNIVEAALFSSGTPLSTKEIGEKTGLAVGAVRKGINALKKELDSRNSALEVTKAGTKFVMQVRSSYLDPAQHFSPPELDREVVKTASLIAYYQPMTQRSLKDLVGGKVYDHVKVLEEAGLIIVKPSGRTKKLTTSKKFPEYFGIDAKNRKDLKEWISKQVD